MTVTDTAYERVTRALAEVTRWQPPNDKGDFLCPAHNDRTPSLSVNRGNKGVVLKCQAGCDTTEILRRLNLRTSDLFDDERPTNGKPEIVATYDYTDEEGRLLFQVVRYTPKTFKQRRRLPGGQWQWSLDDTRRVLYRLPRVIEAVQRGHTIFVVEGEKDVHAVEAAGATATCNSAGAGSWRDEYARSLAGADVVVIADRDEKGRDHARTAAASLESAGCSVTIVEPASGKDVADHLAAGHRLEELVVPGEEPVVEEPPVGAEGEGRSLQAGILRARLLTVAQLKTLPPPTFLVDGVLVRNTLAVLWGKPGSGKSFVALDWALSLAVGAWWFGRKVEKGRVLYVAGEGVGGLNQRVEAWQIARTIYDVPDAMLSIHPGAVNFLDAEWAAALVELAQELQPALVIADTLARVMVGGDENAARDMGVAIDAANKVQNATGASVLFVHHDTKEGSTMRGSSALLGAVDTSIECKADGQQVTLRCEKQKDARPFEDIRMWRDEVGDSCVMASPSGRGINSENEQMVLALLRETADDSGMSHSQIRSMLDSKTMGDRTLYRTLKTLVADGALERIGTKNRSRYRLPESD